MNAPITWHETNSLYLSTALAWLRLRFQSVQGERDSAQLAEAREQMDAAGTQFEPPPAMKILAQQFELSPFEQDLLLLCAAMEFDTRIADLCAQAQGNTGNAYPSFALALALFDNPAWDAQSPERPLRAWRLIEINQRAAQPLVTSALKADERIVNYLKGLNHLDDRLASLVTPMGAEATSDVLQPSQQAVVERIEYSLARAANDSRLPVVQLLGPDQSSKQSVARQTAARFGRHLYRLAADGLPTHMAEIDALARLWRRESLLLPVALYLELPDGELPRDAAANLSLRRFLARADGLVFLNAHEMQTKLGIPAIAFDVAKPTRAEQKAVWQEVLTERIADSHGMLAAQFNLDVTTIRRIGVAAVDEHPDADDDTLQAHVWNACRGALRPGLDTLAHRIDAKATWDDIVLPPEQSRLLHQISAHVRGRSEVYEDWGFARRMNRGLGISALFAGDSGTGKTMAAEVIANELRLDLYRIDLSTVVSKYIGETEANLRRLFDAAEDGGAILFFDEADALFGKRSEVKDSHDRYANIEVNYLLQRIESYAGLAILASNIKSALDIAFMRRLRFIVNFEFPAPAQRALIWQKAFPPGAPLAALDYGRLARFNLTGGNIHSIALNAAFLAADAGVPISMPLVLEAARSEMRKLGRPVNENEFRMIEAVAGAL